MDFMKFWSNDSLIWLVASFICVGIAFASYTKAGKSFIYEAKHRIDLIILGSSMSFVGFFTLICYLIPRIERAGASVKEFAEIVGFTSGSPEIWIIVVSSVMAFVFVLIVLFFFAPFHLKEESDEKINDLRLNSFVPVVFYSVASLMFWTTQSMEHGFFAFIFIGCIIFGYGVASFVIKKRTPKFYEPSHQ